MYLNTSWEIYDNIDKADTVISAFNAKLILNSWTNETYQLILQL